MPTGTQASPTSATSRRHAKEANDASTAEPVIIASGAYSCNQARYSADATAGNRSQDNRLQIIVTLTRSAQSREPSILRGGVFACHRSGCAEDTGRRWNGDRVAATTMIGDRWRQFDMGSSSFAHAFVQSAVRPKNEKRHIGPKRQA